MKKRSKKPAAKPAKRAPRVPRAGTSRRLTRRALAAALDVHMQTITKWEREGLPVATQGRRGRASEYDESAVRTWLKQREDAAAKAPGNLFQERARRECAQAALMEQTYAVRAGELLKKEDVERAWLAEVTAVRAKLLAWPTTLTDALHRAATLDGLPGVERALHEAVRQVLRELAEPAASPRRRHVRQTPAEVAM